MNVLFANNASGTLAGSYSTGATAITLTAGQGALFPSPAGGDWFMATIVDGANNMEIVKCTGRAVDTLTVVRAQEGTAARALNLGDRVELRLTKGVMETLRDKLIGAGQIATDAVTSNEIAPNAVGPSELADGAVDTAAIQDDAVTAAKMADGAAEGNLGFSPVQQGTGVGQLTNDVKIGWSAATKLKAQVDATDLGYLLTELATAKADSAGYRGAPLNRQPNDYTFVIGDTARNVFHDHAVAHAYTIPPNSAVAFDPEGAVLAVMSAQGTVTITPGVGVTLLWLGTGASGARTLAAHGFATLFKVGTDKWYISGTNLS